MTHGAPTPAALRQSANPARLRPLERLMETTMRKLALRIAMTCVCASGCAAAPAEEPGGFVVLADCARSPTPCEAADCFDRARDKTRAQDANTLDLLREVAARACMSLREEQAYGAFEKCLASNGPCDRVACGGAYEASGGERVRSVLPASAFADKAACREASRPTPEQAARAFLNQIYLALSSSGGSGKEAIADFYAPESQIDGVRKHAEAASRKLAEWLRWPAREFEVRQDTVTFSCDPEGRRCRVHGVLDASLSDPADPSHSRNEAWTFDYEFVNVLTNPKVALERSAPMPANALQVPAALPQTAAPAEEGRPPQALVGAAPVPSPAMKRKAGGTDAPGPAGAPEERPLKSKPPHPAASEPTQSAFAGTSAGASAVPAAMSSAPSGEMADVPATDTSQETVPANEERPAAGKLAAKTIEPAVRPRAGITGEPCDREGALGTTREISVAAPSDGGLHIGFETYPTTLRLNEKEIVLTFDDGPNPGTTERVLEALRTECVKATFFLIGRNAAAHPYLVRREIREGHTIGYHTWSHPARTLRGISEDDAIDEITRGFAAVDEARGEVPDKDGTPKTPMVPVPGLRRHAADARLARQAPHRRLRRRPVGRGLGGHVTGSGTRPDDETPRRARPSGHRAVPRHPRPDRGDVAEVLANAEGARLSGRACRLRGVCAYGYARSA